MKKRFCILIEDDWELLGNGLGNVAQLQYLPSLYFMKLAKRLNINLTFMVDVAQQLVFNNYIKHDYNIKMQKTIWDESVMLMKSYGFDVQLHLHPQWVDAQLKEDYFYLNDNWNLGRYPADVQENLIEQSIDYLEQLLRPIDKDYKVIAYKGGSWGMQPSGTLMKSLAKNGVKIVMGVRKGMSLPKNGVDYTNLEETTMPYYPEFEDICKVAGKKTELVIIPLQQVAPGWVSLSALAVDMVKQKIKYPSHTRNYYSDRIPSAISSLSPLLGESKLKLSLKPYITHLKIGNQPFLYLKDSFNKVIEKLSDTPDERIPLVIECHTKQYINHYNDIERFLTYIQENHGDKIEFKSMTEFNRELESDSSMVRIKS